MGININALPDGPFKDKVLMAEEKERKYQERNRIRSEKAFEAWKNGEVPKDTIKIPKRRSKMGNVRCEADGISFDSKREKARYIILKERLEAGEIKDLKLQHNFTLVEGFTGLDGVRVNPLVYKADFTYWERTGEGSWNWIIEDAKGHKTEKYLIKKKLMMDKGFVIRET